MASSLSNRLSREDFKKAKELDELRKTGAAPPELDEDGKMINPHIPQYVAEAPWYLNSNRPGLKHQYMKAFPTKVAVDSMDSWYTRGAKQGPAATGYRKGACENCGSMTHKKKDCVQRPRKKGAVLTGQDIQPDEVIQSFSLDFDGKRDRWNGYDPAQHRRVIELHQKAEEMRAKQKAKQLNEEYKAKQLAKQARREKRKAERDIKRLERKQKRDALKGVKGDSESDLESDTDTDTDDDTDEEESSDDEFKDEGGIISTQSTQSKFTTNRTTCRNLRIREDTAKYLRNLNVNSAYYDPKTRSMRDNPHPNADPKELLYAGDNFIRWTGEARKVGQVNSFVWEKSEREGESTEVHALGNPSQAEMMFERYKEKKLALKASKQQQIVDRYGGQEHLVTDKALLLGESEAYAEYNEAGELLKGQEKLIPRTKYAEDVFENNHTSVWGSYWKAGSWGYSCCHQMIRSSYCTGEAGKRAAAELLQTMESGSAKALFQKEAPPLQIEAAPELKAAPVKRKAEEATTSENGAAGSGGSSSDDAKKRSKRQKKKKASSSDSSSSSSSSSDSSDSDSDSSAKKKRKRKQKSAAASVGVTPQASTASVINAARSKRGYNVVHDAVKPTDEEMEAYMRAKTNSEDPMARMVDTV